MTLKQIVRPILRALRHFIPFYWMIGRTSKFNQLNSRDSDNRKPDDYRNNDVNNETRAAIRGGSIVLGMTISVITTGILLTPVVGQLIAAALAVVVGIGILPGLFDSVAKHAIRGLSWFKTRKNPEIINKTYPQKYKADVIQEYRFPPEFKKEQRETINGSTKVAMKKLYLEKQKIKNNPEGWFGLSKQQKEKCRYLNTGISWFRRITIPFYFANNQKNPITPKHHIISQSNLSSEGHTRDRKDYLVSVLRRASSPR